MKINALVKMIDDKLISLLVSYKKISNDKIYNRYILFVPDNPLVGFAPILMGINR